MKEKLEKKKTKTVQQDNRLYTLEIFFIGGPVTEKFIEKNPVVSRTIEIRGDQTLQNLHRIIFEAFDREEEHMYEFQIGGKGPRYPKAKRYVLREGLKSGSPKPAGDTTRTAIGSLGLKVGQAFGYWFDFGDDWWHQINVVDIRGEAGGKQYPKVTKREGESPPQYADFEGEE
jgi:hypothetical protein